jgi:hypothetical protein
MDQNSAISKVNSILSWLRFKQKKTIINTFLSHDCTLPKCLAMNRNKSKNQNRTKINAIVVFIQKCQKIDQKIKN